MSDSNRAVQLQKQARSLKFWFYEEEKLYYPCSENKGADQLCRYCEADLRLCFRIGKNTVSHDVAHFRHKSAKLLSHKIKLWTYNYDH